MSYELRIKNLAKSLLLYVAVVAVTLSLPAATLGQEGGISPTIGVSPAKLFETVKPGKTSTYQIRLRNLGQDAIPLAASLTDIDSISEDGIPIFSEKASKRSAVDWIKLAETDLIVSPGEQKTVAVSVTPPKNAAPGGYTAAIFFQAKLPSFYFDLDAGTRVLPAVTVLAFFSIAGKGEITVEGLEIEELNVPAFVVSSPVSLVAKIQNPSSFFVQADASAQIKSATGSTETDDIGRIIVLPEDSRRLVSAFEGGVLPGFYTAQFELKQGDKVFIASARFFAFPWQSLLVLILLLIVGLGLAGRRRLRHAILVLSGKPVPREPRQRPTIR
ncbi:MAG: hypothetical protein WD544_01835 [Patescibacteria group bacterium]